MLEMLEMLEMLFCRWPVLACFRTRPMSPKADWHNNNEAV
jgi:hypothetical protein